MDLENVVRYSETPASGMPDPRLSCAACPPTLSYCVVNTNGRDYLLACLAAIEATHPAGVEREILVLDNASDRRLGRRGRGRSAARSG